MIDNGTLGTVAELGVALAGFSGIVLVLVRGGAELTRLEADRLGIMLGGSLGATFLALLPLVLAAYPIEPATACRIGNATMAAGTAAFLRYYIRATLQMRARVPELVSPLPFGLVSAGHGINLFLQTGAAIGLLACEPAYVTGLFWLLFHGAYQFGRILFIRPRAGAVNAPVSSGAPAAEAVTSPAIPGAEPRDQSAGA